MERGINFLIMTLERYHDMMRPEESIGDDSDSNELPFRRGILLTSVIPNN